MNNITANALNILQTYEKLGKEQAVLKPVSKMLVQILTILKDHGYVGDVTVTETRRGGQITVNLIGKINKCAAISPNFPVSLINLEEKERRYLPAKGFGILIVTTPKGVMTHQQAKEAKIGGRLLAYCY